MPAPGPATQTNLTLGPARNRTPWFVLGAISLALVGALGAWLLAPVEHEGATLPPPPPVDAGLGAGLVAAIDTEPVSPPVDAGATQPADAGPLAVTAQKRPTHGTLTVDATPWALLTLDGRALGETPRAEVPVPSGVHLLVATCPDTGKTERRKITIVSGRAREERFDLR